MPRVLPTTARFLAFAVAALIYGNGLMAGEQAPSLTAKEKAEGWRLLFDGTTLNGWRAWKSETPSPGWKVVDGVLFREAGGGDLVTADEFGDFELTLDWKLDQAPGGNSGIFFRVTQEGEQAWWSGPEFQILDNAGHRDGKNPLTSAGANYAVHAPAKDVTKPLGEWNSVRLIVKGAHVEHWMNGVKLLEYEMWSDDWAQRVQASKFGKIPIYGKARSGRIGLQDHGNPVWFRNIKIRPL